MKAQTSILGSAYATNDFDVVARVVVACAVSAGAAGPASIADAAMSGDRAAVRALIKQGADVNAPQGDGVTALHWAARAAMPSWRQALVAAGANARAATRFGAYTPLHLAAERGSAPVVAALVEAGAPVNARTSTGATPLMFAAARRRHRADRGAPRRRRRRQRRGNRARSRRR